jgi:hypothetical protein
MIMGGIKGFASLDTIFFLGIVAIVAVIFGWGLTSGNFKMFSFVPLNISGILLPLSSILFSLSGRSAISSMKEHFNDKKYSQKNFLKSVALGTFIPVIVYVAFIFGVTALSGFGITPDAVSGLSHLPFGFLCAIGVLGFLAIITSYVFLGIELKGILEKDGRTKHLVATSVAVMLPIILYFLGFNNFIFLVGFVGGLFLAVESIIVIMMRRVATMKRRPYDFVLITVFLVAAIYELVVFFS